MLNRVTIMGRLTSDPDIRYTKSEQPIAVAKYTLAVNRRKKANQSESEADFIKCVSFGKNGEFAEKYLKKAKKIIVTGKITTGSWEDNDGKKHWSTQVVVEEHFFCDGDQRNDSNNIKDDSKSIVESYGVSNSSEDDEDPFDYPI